MTDVLSAVPVLVLGAGSWGTALATLACQQASTLLWARNASHIPQINKHHQLPHYLPGVDLPINLQATDDFTRGMQHVLANDTQAGLIILGVPLAGLKDISQRINAHLPATRQHPLYLLRTCKGLDPQTAQLPHQITDQHLENKPWLHSGTLSGPSFALEVAKGLPVALTVASHNAELTDCAVDVLHGNSARIYASDDIIGVEIGGALKNIIAIACGICDGLHLGSNARAALITRGLAETQRIGVALGGKAETFSGLTGLGDLVLTTTGDLSRNRQVGLAIAQGQDLATILDSGLTAEGVRCAQAALSIAQKNHIDAPITQAVCDVLFHHLTPVDAVHQLLARVSRSESPFSSAEKKI